MINFCTIDCAVSSTLDALMLSPHRLTTHFYPPPNKEHISQNRDRGVPFPGEHNIVGSDANKMRQQNTTHTLLRESDPCLPEGRNQPSDRTLDTGRVTV